MTPETLLVVAAVVVAYVGHCWLYPWTTCGRCGGGKIRNDTGKVRRDCGRCGGAGKRKRLAARLLGR